MAHGAGAGGPGKPSRFAWLDANVKAISSQRFYRADMRGTAEGKVGQRPSRRLGGGGSAGVHRIACLRTIWRLSDSYFGSTVARQTR